MARGNEFLSTCSATLGWAFGTSRRGGQHAGAGTVCQDAFAAWSGSFRSRPCILVAVADGLGDEQYDRSDTGAALAVRAGIDEMIAFFQAYAGAASSAQLGAWFRADFPRRVTRRWRSYVAADREARGKQSGDDPDELATCARYGTTLLAGMATEEAILLGQIGDGDIRIVRPSGETLVPFRPDPAVVGKATHSLASRDAHLLWQTAAYSRDEGAAVLLATDGLPDSFGGDGDAEYARFAGSFLDRIRTFGVEEVASQLPVWLDRYSLAGSGDDVTLALIRINPDRTADTGAEENPDPTADPSAKEGPEEAGAGSVWEEGWS
jgi:serine/threonine protein phosphatase PrpC